MAIKEKSLYLMKNLVEPYLVNVLANQFNDIYFIIPNDQKSSKERDMRSHCDIRCRINNEILDFDAKTKTKKEYPNITWSTNLFDYIQDEKPENHYTVWVHDQGCKMTGSHYYAVKSSDMIKESKNYDDSRIGYVLFPTKLLESSDVTKFILFDGDRTNKWNRQFLINYENEKTKAVKTEKYKFSPKQFKFIFHYCFDKLNEKSQSMMSIEKYINTFDETLKESCEYYNFNDSIYSSLKNFIEKLKYWK